VGAAIVANDRVFVASDDGGWTAHGVPTIVQVRGPTITLLPELRWPRAGEEQPVMSTLEQATWDEPGAAGPGSSPLMLSLAQLAHAAGAPLEPGGALRCIALVGHDESVPRYTVRWLEPGDAERRLDEVRFGASTEPRAATVFEAALGHATPPTARRDLGARLARGVPCAEVRVGPPLLASPDAAAALLDELFDR
jgi:hypothetical protein